MNKGIPIQEDYEICAGKGNKKEPPQEYTQYWENMYRRQQEEIPQNEYEYKVLEDLGKGKTITECINWLKESLGISHEEASSILDDLCDRCNEWEIANMSDIGRSTSENNGKH